MLPYLQSKSDATNDPETYQPVKFFVGVVLCGSHKKKVNLSYLHARGLDANTGHISLMPPDQELEA